MKLSGALNLGSTPPANDAQPFNIDAEQAVLGAVLYDNAAIERVDETLRAEHFYEPLHGRLWDAVLSLARSGKVADPVLVFERIKDEPSLQDLGGIRYLADLVDRAPPAANAPDYAGVIHDLWLRRRVMDIAANAMAAASGSEYDSANAVVEGVEAELYALVETRREQGFQNLDHYIAEAIQMAAKAYERDGGLSGTSTGLIDLDQKTGGLHPSDLIILAGRPSMGKTALATNIAFDVARSYAFETQTGGAKKTVRGGRVGFFSLEMSGEQLAMRILAEASGVSSDRLRKGSIKADEFGRVRDAAIELQDAPLFVDDTGGLTIDRLCARARRMKRRTGLDLLVVDYLQLIQPSRTRAGANRVEQITEISIALKGLAKELDVPIIALSQLSRQVENREDKRPQLADLRESGSIEQDADAVWFVYREAYYLGRKEPRENTAEHHAWVEEMDVIRNVAEVILGKQRHGPIGSVKLSFNEELTKFGNLGRDGRYQPPDAPGGLRFNPGAN
jgi:replicative DNA helicase